MPKRKIIFLAIFSIIVFCSVIYFLPSVHAINFRITDVEDDVLRYACGTEDTGDYFDEIDIVELIVAGKNINVTVAGNFASWGSSHYGTVIFSPYIHSDGTSYGYPWYKVHWENKSGPIEATLEKGYQLSINTFAYEVWNGTGWEAQNTGTPAIIVVDVTEHSVIAYIPDAVEEIPSTMKVLARTHLYNWSDPVCMFSDVTRIPPSVDNGIPSYNLFLLICTMIGVSLIIIKKYKK
ncbi:MAG: hypothetical protein KAX18_00450 [Candidatus Lokiarchaeota archaeon]|nr:hypothetical protein [Candidatus Lokiarchaeota archaeon]